jgi:hypothetical protein
MAAWLRWEDRCSTDPKWRVVARKAEVPVAYVVAVWASILEAACQARDGGRYELDPEVAGEALGINPDKVALIHRYMQGKVLEGDRVLHWNRYQPPSTERVHRMRAKRNETG